MSLARLIRLLTLGLTSLAVVGFAVYHWVYAPGLLSRWGFSPDEVSYDHVHWFVGEGLALLLVLNLGGWLSELWLLRSSTKALDQLSLSLLRQAPFLAGAGVCVKDADLKIIFCNDAFLAPYRLALTDVIGALVQDRFPPAIATMLERLDQDALASKAEAQLTVPYPGQAQGTMRAASLPVYGPHGRFIGMINTIADCTQQVQAEYDAARHQHYYQTLFTNLPVGAALFRGVILPDGSPDFFMEDANPAYLRIIAGAPVPGERSLRTCWPSLNAQTEFLAGAAAVVHGGPMFEHEIFSVLTGLRLRITLAWLGHNKIVATFMDVTELRQAEARLLQTGDQLRANVTTHRVRGDRLLQDANHFLYAVADKLQAPLDWIDALEGDEARKQSELLHLLLSSMMLYANSSLLPYKSTLTRLDKLVMPLLEAARTRTPHITFEAGALPSLAVAESVVESILKYLLIVLSMQPADQGRIKVSVSSGFLDSYLCVEVQGMDLSAMFQSGFPSDWAEVDWRQADCLQLAAVCRMVLCHGGWCKVGKTESGSILFKFLLEPCP